MFVLWFVIWLLWGVRLLLFCICVGFALYGCLLIACWVFGVLIVLCMLVVLCFGCFLGFEFCVCLHAYCLLAVGVVLSCFLFICGLIVCWFWVWLFSLVRFCLM